MIHISDCFNCRKECLWVNGKMLLPDVNSYPPANEDMPNDVKEIYGEAAAVANKSPRAAAALLRLALQELCKELDSPSKNLHEQINHLVKSQKLPSIVIEAMDVVRLVGNDAVHPDRVGVDIESDSGVVPALFRFINLITEKAISEPNRMKAEIGAISATFPESKRIKPQNGENP